MAFMGLGNIFGGKKKEDKAEERRPEGFIHTTDFEKLLSSYDDMTKHHILSNYQHAQYGQFFRTRAFAMPGSDEGTKEWLEAHRLPNNYWVVQKKRATTSLLPNNAVHADRLVNISQSTLKGCEKLPFFMAVYKLAEYEGTEEDLGSHPTMLPSIENLADKHFKKFAEREGIVFDVNGIPYPSYERCIIGKSIFPQSAMDKLEKVVETKQKMLESHPVKPGELSKTFKESSKEVPYVDCLHMQGFINALEKVRTGVMEILRHGGKRTPITGPSDPDIGKTSYDRMMDSVRLSKAAIELWVQDSDARLVKQDPALEVLCHRAIQTMLFYAEYAEAHNSIASIKSRYNTMSHKADLSNHLAYVEESARRLKRLGGTDESVEHMKAALLNIRFGYSHHVREPEGMAEMMHAFSVLMNAMSNPWDEKADIKKAAETIMHPPFTPVPEVKEVKQEKKADNPAPAPKSDPS